MCHYKTDTWKLYKGRDWMRINSTLQIIQQTLHGIWGSHGSNNKENYLLRCDTMYWHTLQSWWWRQYVPTRKLQKSIDWVGTNRTLQRINHTKSVRFEAVTAAIIKRSIFWNVTTCSLIEATDISDSTFWACLAYSSTLIIKVVRSSKMAVNVS
jgi:hypothetical protein